MWQTELYVRVQLTRKAMGHIVRMSRAIFQTILHIISSYFTRQSRRGALLDTAGLRAHAPTAAHENSQDGISQEAIRRLQRVYLSLIVPVEKDCQLRGRFSFRGRKKKWQRHDVYAQFQRGSRSSQPSAHYQLLSSAFI